ncbi:methyl-accepting chemotaxis protein [Marinomonas epiphytica]
MSIKFKTVLMMLSVSMFSLIAFSTFNYVKTTSDSKKALDESYRKKLVAIRESKLDAIYDYLKYIDDLVIAQSSNPYLADALSDFSNAYYEYRFADSKDFESLNNFYSSQFKEKFDERNTNKALDISALVQKLSPQSKALQNDYIALNSHEMGEKHFMNDAGLLSSYDSAHSKYHSYLRSFLEKFSLYDVFLISAKGDVVYSVFKEVDFATSLINGPYSSSGLAEAYKLSIGNVSNSHIVDFKTYTPSFEAPAAFISHAIKNNEGELLGSIVVQLPIDKINEVMTSKGRWVESGLGYSGETYLVGHDSKARSISRFLVEDKETYLKAIGSSGVDEETLESIRVLESNIGLQVINTASVKAALSGESGYKVVKDYRNVSVLSAYAPLNFPGLNWAVLSEVDTEEAFADSSALSQTILLSSLLGVGVFSLIAAVIGYYFSKRLTQPIVNLNNTIDSVLTQNNLSLRATVNEHSNDEISKISSQLNKLLSAFSGILSEVLQASNSISDSSDRLSGAAKETMSRTNQQKIETESLATAMNEMVASVNEIASNTSLASLAAQETDSSARTGNDVVKSTQNMLRELQHGLESSSKVIHELSEDSDKISQILTVISDIAEQTNLLALNAAIEAARAGEQGRGFAVVADEVRTLAGRTQDSTEQVSQIIRGLQSRSSSAVLAINENNTQAEKTVKNSETAYVALQEIEKSSAQILDMNLQVASSAEEQGLVANDINKNVVSIDETAQLSLENARAVDEASKGLEKLSKKLQSLAKKYQF